MTEMVATNIVAHRTTEQPSTVLTKHEPQVSELDMWKADFEQKKILGTVKNCKNIFLRTFLATTILMFQDNVTK